MSDQVKFVPFVCTACHQEIEAPAEMEGQSVECPSCGTRLTVPSADQGPTPAQINALKSRTIRIELEDI